MQKTLIIFVILALLLTGGCGNQGYIPVYTAGERLTGNHYLVRHGDTLYSIAFRFGLDYRTLAVANNIQPPYTIFVNQRIRLAPVAAAAADKPSSKSNSTSAENTIASEVKRSLPTTTPKIPDTSIQWRWPYEGEVVNRFSLSGKVNKGIDIRGRIGDPVRSTADGIVVYAGGGLRGYGKLVIVKHNERYLSAYGHNQSILVQEGDEVKGGQIVARIGGPNGDKDLLHFEIRQDGKPEDPLHYLPALGQDSQAGR